MRNCKTCGLRDEEFLGCGESIWILSDSALLGFNLLTRVQVWDFLVVWIGSFNLFLDVSNSFSRNSIVWPILILKIFWFVVKLTLSYYQINLWVDFWLVTCNVDWLVWLSLYLDIQIFGRKLVNKRRFCFVVQFFDSQSTPHRYPLSKL